MKIYIVFTEQYNYSDGCCEFKIQTVAEDKDLAEKYIKLHAVMDEYGNGYTKDEYHIVEIDSNDTNEKTLKEFMKKRKYAWRVIFDKKGNVVDSEHIDVTDYDRKEVTILHDYSHEDYHLAIIIDDNGQFCDPEHEDVFEAAKEIRRKYLMKEFGL